VEREWTEWTSALAVAEGLTDWVADRYPGKWAGEVDLGPAVMVLLAHAIQAASRDQGLRVTHPDQFGPLALRRVGEYLTVDRAPALLDTEDGVGPAAGEIGVDHVTDLARVSDLPDQGQWRRIVRRAADVVATHVATPPASQQERTIASRKSALATNTRRRVLVQLGEFFGGDS